jgi:hypothetical protein
MKRKKSVAVLIFARSPLAESLQKRLVKGSLRNSIQAFDKLNRRILDTVEKTNLPFFHIDENDQVGDSFHERFQNAFQTIFDKGFENVISVGNDTPAFAQEYIWKTIDQLRTSDVVFGATQKGGIYTLGLSKKGFRSMPFEQLPWNQHQLSSTLREWLETGCISHTILKQKLQELNTSNDIQLVRSNAPKHRFLSRLLSFILNDIIRQVQTPFHQLDLHKNLTQHQDPLRGPPFAIIHIQ